MPTTIDDTLAASSFAAGMAPDLRTSLADIAEVHDIADGAVLVRAGFPCDALGVVVDGRIAIRPIVPGLGKRTILTLEQGDIFGWSAVLAGANASSDAIAISRSRVVLFERDALARAMDAEPRLAAEVYRRVLSAVARRLQSTRLQLLDLYRAGDEPW